MSSKIQCPCCAEKVSARKTSCFAIVTCPKCEAVFTPDGFRTYLGNTYSFVLPWFDQGKAEKEVYFDFSYLGSEGPGRRHGWFNPATKLVTQVG